MGRCVVCFSMADANHFGRLLPVIAGLAACGEQVYVFTDDQFRAAVEEAGGYFVDLFGRYPLELADDASLPRICRYVSYAGRFAEQVADEVRRLDPGLIVYGTFAVIGYVIARRIGVPYVNVCAGHNLNPGVFQQKLAVDPRVALDPACERAARTLRERFDIPEADPFLFVATQSPFLNLYGEPEQYLTEDERQAFQPIAFFGSIMPRAGDRAPQAPPLAPASSALRVYVSFGTIIWRHFAPRALSALEAISIALSRYGEVQATISLGGHALDESAISSLRGPGVSVERYVDQWEILQRSDLFLTHHGMNSTHEAIYHRVPMLSYPFFWDQPGLANRCQELGLALPVVHGEQQTLQPEDVLRSVEAFLARRDQLASHLSKAASWERQTIDRRPRVIRLIRNLIAE